MKESQRQYSLRKRELVTGGAGFLGSHLCGRLIEDGHDVLFVDTMLSDVEFAEKRLVLAAL